MTASGPKIKVLVIDDNSGILFIMRQALEIKKYRVYTEESFDGVDAVAKIAPDLIYLDISLAGHDGREVSRELKSAEATRHIPVVILTAHPDMEQLTKEAEADDHMPKPFELEHLWKITAKYTTQTKNKLLS